LRSFTIAVIGKAYLERVRLPLPGGLPASVYVGVSSMFQAAGFTEIDRRGIHPVYRLTLDG
jgi:hypothetical protein